MYLDNVKEEGGYGALLGNGNSCIEAAVALYILVLGSDSVVRHGRLWCQESK